MNWKDSYKRKLCTADEAVSIIKSGDKVIQGQCHGISRTLTDALCRRKGELTDITVFSSLNFIKEGYLDESYWPDFQYLNGFLFPESRKAYKAGRVDYLQMHFVEFPNWIKNVWKPQVAMPVLSMPDEDGYCSFSLNADYMIAGCEVAESIIAHVNPSAPKTYGKKIHIDRLTRIVESDESLMEIPMGRAGDIEKKIAEYIAERIPDGACLQLGVGGIPDTVLSLLSDKKDLGIHSELFSDGVAELYEKGVITGACKQIDTGKIVTTMILGTKTVHKFAHNNPDVLVLPVDYTNNPYVIAKNDNMISINSCLEIDFLGQINADFVNGSFFSGVGGQVDFVRGAMMSRGGQSFITLPSTALKGTVSTIVPRLQSPVTTARHEVRSIVTEYGIADLFGKTIRERVKSLINIAHPDFREELTRAAYEAKYLF